MATTQRTKLKCGRKLQDITGKRFGRLVVILFVGMRGGQSLWLCRCDCGKEVVVVRTNLTNRRVNKSCGCLRDEMLAARSYRHGMSRTVEHKTWDQMLGRCYRKNDDSYPNYGGRGIKVCLGWQTFENFFADMGNRPPKHSLDRIGVNGHYSCGKCEECQQNGWPSNCRWATQQEQCLNMRTNVFFEVNGEKAALAEWARRSGLDGTTITRRIERGWTVSDAVLTPSLRPKR